MAISIWAGVEVDAVGRKIIEVAEFYPDKQYLYVTSSKRDEPGSYHSSALTYAGSATSAVDFGAGGRTALGDQRMCDFARWIIQFYANLIELIHSTPYADDNGFYVKNQAINNNVYSTSTKDAHLDHIHVASSSLLLDQLLVKLRGTAVPGLPPAPAPTSGTFTPEQAVHFEALCWRIDAMIAAKPVVTGGPSTGELNKFRF